MIAFLVSANAQKNDIIETYSSNGTKICRQNCGNAYANNCPPVTCPRPDNPPLDRTCPAPDCNTPVANWLLWPIAEDPTAFFKCRAFGVWDPERMACGCGTLFD